MYAYKYKSFCLFCEYLCIIDSLTTRVATAKHPWPEFSNNLAALFHVATSKDPPPTPDNMSAGAAILLRRY